ncbi:MAG TPA: cyclase family protein [Pyrinomonadaceae bacterium]|nr:cyclase family protein [Pyrinomonadaceae bacterium]
MENENRNLYYPSMAFYDVTVPLSNELPTYPGDPGIQIGDWRSLAKGDSANVSVVNFGAHTGTHVDAPAHFIEGAAKIETLPLDALIGEALVVEAPNDCHVIDGDFVQARVAPGTERVLFKTRNSAFWNEPEPQFHSDFTHLILEAATWLRDQGAKLVGIDYLSIERFKSPGHPTHLALLTKGIVILEGLNLSDVPPGRYELFCLPLKLRSHLGDGAPARAVLRTLE